MSKYVLEVKSAIKIGSGEVISAGTKYEVDDLSEVPFGVLDFLNDGRGIVVSHTPLPKNTSPKEESETEVIQESTDSEDKPKKKIVRKKKG